jgi:hypothetical protein
MLATAYGSRDAHNTRAVCLLAIATVAIDCGCGLLKMLLAPLPTTLGTLPGILDGDVRRHLPAVAQGRTKLGHLVAGGVLGSDAV